MKLFHAKNSIVLFILCLCTGLCFAQVKTDYQLKKAAVIKQLIMQINQHPDSLALHEQYIFEASLDSPRVKKQYDLWMQQFPNAATIPFALGRAYANSERPEAGKYLLKTIALDSLNAEAWSLLSLDALTKGDHFNYSLYAHKASLIKPQNIDYAFNYAFSLRDIDTVKWRSAVLDFVDRHPKEKRGAQALYWLTEQTTDTATKLNLLERLYKQFPPKKYMWSSYSTELLYHIYLEQSPEKALTLSNEMNWLACKKFVQNIIAIDSLIKIKSYQAAMDLVDSSQHIRNYNPDKINAYANLSSNEYLSLKRASINDLLGNTKTAYDTLITKMAKAPTRKLAVLLNSYAAKLGISQQNVNHDIWQQVSKAAKPALNFSSKLYTEDKLVSLADYRGKVVLLTFWFPGCAPCRAEFPHFENVLHQFSNQQVAYLAVNTMPEQDNFVLDFVKRAKVSFIPLHGRWELAAKYYGASAYPANFLVDQQGNIIYSNFRITDDNEDNLALMINLALHHNDIPQSYAADTVNKVLDTAKIK